MNQKGFELTDKEIIKNLDLDYERDYINHAEGEYLTTVDVDKLLKAQIAKVLSKLAEKKEEWCPQHGYPLPCYKCGYSGEQIEKSIKENGNELPKV